MSRLVSALTALLLLIGCDGDKGPYLSFAGGGFVFNYRIAEIYYGFVLKPERKLPEGSVIEARFEDPAGGPDIVIDAPARSGQLQYMFRTPAVKGVRKDKDYRVEVRLLDKPQGTALASMSPMIVGPTIEPTRPTPSAHPNPVARIATGYVIVASALAPT